MLLKVAGIDPSLAHTGLAAGTFDTETKDLNIDRLALIETEKGTLKMVRQNSDDVLRASILTKGIHDWIKDAQVVAVEVPVGSQSAVAMKALGICTGIIGGIGLVGVYRGKALQVQPTEVKLIATGSKHATKDEMIQAAVKRWPDAGWLTRKLKGKVELIAKNEHLADASFAIEAALATDGFQTLLEMLSSLSQSQV